ncbi:MAG: 4-(cytidine 5'-diphospho)-2-C-methyl-D-erythritol kinase [Bacilli bacterium]|nr:4-(cytidine 5'-diphospho)-2-C-methyl-D-erythritol kinase [Bacilli bacterium]
MYAKAYAKINVFLDVLGRREDGYHDLKMVMLPIELHDSISISVLPYSPHSSVVCDHIELKATKYNMVNKTLLAMKDKYSFDENFTIVVHKEIPIAAGLGGGSSNAAATMKAIYSILKIEDTLDSKLALAKSLGADVPFCLLNQPALVEGIGEKITPIKLKDNWYVLIVMPDVGLSTKDVFEKADTMELGHGNAEEVIEALTKGDEERLGKAMYNSLQAVSTSMNPEIQPIIDLMKSDGVSAVMMSGSGSSVFAISKNKMKLQKLYTKYEKLNLDVYLTKVIKEHE